MMRVISQDGMIDIPYEMVVIQRFQEKIYFLNKNLTGVEHPVDDVQLAEYSTSEKAEKAMEMLKERYLEYISVRGGESPFTGAVTQPGIWTVPKVFRFPADEEVGVTK